jgi:hypothetical protein
MVIQVEDLLFLARLSETCLDLDSDKLGSFSGEMLVDWSQNIAFFGGPVSSYLLYSEPPGPQRSFVVFQHTEEAADH